MSFIYLFILFVLYHTQLINSYVLCNYKKSYQIPTSITNKITYKNLQSSLILYNQMNNRDSNKKVNQPLLTSSNDDNNQIDKKTPSAFDEVASKGLAGVLAIACAEAIFWALGVPLASLYYKYTTGEWIDLTSTEGQLQATAFSFGYGGFATVILQYRVTLFAIPLIPIMENLIVKPGKKLFGEKFGNNENN